MKLKTGWALAIVAALSGTLAAQDGGKIPWKGKGSDDLKAIMDEAKKEGKAMMMFFTSEG